MNSVTFIKNFKVKPFKKGATLLGEGDISNTLLAIQEGFVKVTAIDDAGNERMLWIASRYDIVPTERLFSTSRPLKFFYTAQSDGAAYHVDKAQFIATAKTDATFMGEIASNMSAHYDDLLSRISASEQTTVRERLIANLRYVAERFSAEQQVNLYSLGLRLTHEDIATLVGSTRETVSLELQKLRSAGAITYDREQFIVNLDKCLP